MGSGTVHAATDVDRRCGRPCLSLAASDCQTNLLGRARELPALAVSAAPMIRSASTPALARTSFSARSQNSPESVLRSMNRSHPRPAASCSTTLAKNLSPEAKPIRRCEIEPANGAEVSRPAHDHRSSPPGPRGSSPVRSRVRSENGAARVTPPLWKLRIRDSATEAIPLTLIDADIKGLIRPQVPREPRIRPRRRAGAAGE